MTDARRRWWQRLRDLLRRERSVPGTACLFYVPAETPERKPEETQRLVDEILAHMATPLPDGQAPQRLEYIVPRRA